MYNKVAACVHVSDVQHRCTQKVYSCLPISAYSSDEAFAIRHSGIRSFKIRVRTLYPNSEFVNATVLNTVQWNSYDRIGVER